MTKVENGFFVTVGKKGYICPNDQSVENLITGGVKDLLVELNSNELETPAPQE